MPARSVLASPAAALACLIAVAGCSDEELGGAAVTTATATTTTTEGGGGGGGGCPAGSEPTHVGCVDAGVRACAQGFGKGPLGCEPVLPAESCPSGTMAIPGEVECRLVAPCPDDPFGEAPRVATTRFVDASYLGADADGSEAKPWSTIAPAVAEAIPGAVVAIAAGDYAENVLVGSPVVLWGRCPEVVHIAGDPSGGATIFFETGSDGSTLRTLSVSSEPGLVGVAVSGATDILVDRVWLHDVAEAAVQVEKGDGEASLTAHGVLVERSGWVGMAVFGARLDIDESTVRDVGGDDYRSGLLFLDSVVRASGSVSRSVVERIEGTGIYVSGADVTVDATHLRGITTSPAGGFAVAVQDAPNTDPPSTLAVTKSVIADCEDVAVYVSGTSVTLEDTVIRDIAPRPSGDRGYGAAVEPHPETGVGGTLVVRHSVVSAATTAGVAQFGSSLTLEASRITGTRPTGPAQHLGRGLNVQRDSVSGAKGATEVRYSLLDGNREFGVFLFEAVATIEGTVVRDTLARSGDGLFGDGIASMAADATIRTSRIEHGARAGVSSFGGTMALGDCVLWCNPIQLAASEGAEPVTFHDLGGNVCACDGATASCSLQLGSVTPPDPL